MEQGETLLICQKHSSVDKMAAAISLLKNALWIERNQDGKQNQVKSPKKTFEEAQLDSARRRIVGRVFCPLSILCTATFIPSTNRGFFVF